MRKLFIWIGSVVGLSLLALYALYYAQGRRFALRDRLKKADAIVVLAGTRGNITFLDGKVQTAARLYHEGWAPSVIGVGKFSMKVTETPTLIPLEELQYAVAQGRIQEKDVRVASEKWDTSLGASYIHEKLCQLGVPEEQILLERESLHTRENAEYVLCLLQQHDMQQIILVTSPFHQLRTYLTFAKVLQPADIAILNYYADANDWHPFTWFFSQEHRKLVKSEQERIKLYRAKGDL